MDTCGGKTNLERWVKWFERRFEIFIRASEVANDAAKINIFLHVAGEQVEEIYNVLATKQESKLEDVTKLITNHFAPQVNVDEQILKFRKMHQMPGESIDSFIIRLKTQAEYCKFTSKDNEIKLQVITGCISNKIKQKATQETITYDDLVKYARSLEGIQDFNDSTNQQQQIKQENLYQIHQRLPTQTSKSINNRTYNNNYTNSNSSFYSPSSTTTTNIKKTCGFCGYEYPHTGNCPAKGKVCRKCDKLNHFERCCRSRTNINHFNNTNQHQKFTKQPQIHQIQSFQSQSPSSSPSASSNMDQYQNNIEENSIESSNSSLYYNIFAFVNEIKQCPRINVVMCNTNINMGIDTQASINAISSETYHSLNEKPTLVMDTIETYAYDSIKPLRSMGKFTTTIHTNNRQHTTEITVFEGVRDNLLSCESSLALGLINLTYAIGQVDSFRQNIIKQYPNVFSGKIGKLKDCEVKFHINKEIKPVIQPIRRIPLHLREKVELELEAMERDDLIEDATGPTPWVSEMVIVPKPHNKDEIRIVIDARPINVALERERHNMPTLEELVVDFNQAKIISKLDLKAGYHQIVLSEDSRYITTFRTPKGLKRFKRLTQGFKPSQELCHHTYETKLQGLRGVKLIVDDIFVYGSTVEEHDDRLHKLLQRLNELGLTVNEKKCEFRKEELEFFGLKFSKDGIAITESKIKALKDAKAPNTASELRSFLGLATYCSRSIPKFAEKSSKLWALTRLKSKFIWSDEHETQFNSIKQSIIKDELGYFNKEWSTYIEVDASPVGAAAVLYQSDPLDPEHKQIISFWSQLFSDVEKRYSQVEKEALAIVLACEKFRLYLLGKTFTLITDNKAVELILRNPNSKPPARIERWNVRLMDFHFNIIHKPGNSNIADYLSRHPLRDNNIHTNAVEAEQYINFIETHAKPIAITLNELIDATKLDTVLQKVISCLNQNKFPNDNDLTPFKHIKDDLSITSSGLLLRDRRIVIPRSLQLKVAQIAHEGHQGLNKTKRLLRERVWYPGVDKQIENLISSCATCQLNNNGTHYRPLKPSPFPLKPWQQISIDFFGPLPNKHELMVITDAHSKFPIVIEVKSTSASNVLPELESIISLIGIPSSIKSDNGPPFNGYEFTNFCKFFGIEHKKITPLWPQANGQCENFNKNLKKIIKNAVNSHTNWKIELNSFLRSYRNTPHSSTNVSPSSLLFINSNTIRLPNLNMEFTEKHQNLIQKAKFYDTKAKYQQKKYSDFYHHVKPVQFKIGDTVLYAQNKEHRLNNKFNNQFSTIKYTVKNIKGSMIEVEDLYGNKLVRNVSFFKPITSALN